MFHWYFRKPIEPINLIDLAEKLIKNLNFIDRKKNNSVGTCTLEKRQTLIRPGPWFCKGMYLSVRLYEQLLTSLEKKIAKIAFLVDSLSLSSTNFFYLSFLFPLLLCAFRSFIYVEICFYHNNFVKFQSLFPFFVFGIKSHNILLLHCIFQHINPNMEKASAYRILKWHFIFFILHEQAFLYFRQYFYCCAFYMAMP